MINLFNRTENSFKYASGKIPRVLDRQDPGAKVAGIADRGGTWGHVRWEKECKARGLTPVFGVELAVVWDMELREKQPASFVRLIATSQKGLASLYLATTMATEKFYFIPRVDFSYVAGLVAEGGLAAVWDNGILAYLKGNPLGKKAPKGHLFLAGPGAIASTLAAARSYSLPLIAGSNNLYPSPEDRPAYEIVVGSRAVEMRTSPGHILGGEEWGLLPFPEKDRAEALKNLSRLASEASGVAIPKGTMVDPRAEKTLRAMCLEGAKKLGVDLRKKEYKDRLERELAMIAEKGFEDYLFVVSDMIRYAKTVMLVGPARGSSCGSLVCYLTGITMIDPLPYGLLFERFIDITRKDLPDIDIDFQDDRREMVFDYLREKYGHANIARLGTINFYKAKSAITDVAKALLIPEWETTDLKGSIIERSGGDARATFCIADTFEQLEIGRDLLKKYPELRWAGELEAHARHSGMHAAGILITADPVTNYGSVDAKGNCIQLDKKDAEALGLLKIDALGLRTLSVIQDALDQVGMRREDLTKIPLDYQPAFDIINAGAFAGIFQFEGYALQNLCKKIRLDRFEDVVSITALARPGPLISGGAEEYMQRRAGNHPVEYLHPLIEPMTNLSFGIIVYQEQVMEIVREIGGLSWEDVSDLRKAMSKSLGQEFFEKYWERFKVGAKRIGIHNEKAREIWEKVNTMGSWAFNRSHAVAYGLVSYWCLWLKAKHPLEFAAACLRSSKDDDQSVKILRELSKEGYQYKSFDRDLSEMNWIVADGKLIGGLTSIKGVGEKLATAILTKRKKGLPFTPREEKLLTSGETPWDHIYEAKDLWGHLREDPARYGISSRIATVEEIKDGPDGVYVFLGKIMVKNLRDHNEPKLIERRGGRRMNGQTLYLNMTLEDDTASIFAGIDRHNYLLRGKPIVEEAKTGEWYLWKGEKKKSSPTFKIFRWKRLTGAPEYQPHGPGMGINTGEDGA